MLLLGLEPGGFVRVCGNRPSLLGRPDGIKGRITWWPGIEIVAVLLLGFSTHAWRNKDRNEIEALHGRCNITARAERVAAEQKKLRPTFVSVDLLRHINAVHRARALCPAVHKNEGRMLPGRNGTRKLSVS